MVDFEEREVNHRNCPLTNTPGGAGALFGGMLILAGVLLFLDNLNILPIEMARAFWPLALIIWSIAWLVRCRSTAAKVWSTAGSVAGVLLLLGRSHIIPVSMRILWPIALIATGTVMLIYRIRWLRFSRKFVVGASLKSTSISSGTLEEVAVFSSINRKLETADFTGGELTAVFGAIEIDMRFAAMTPPLRPAVLEANAIFGSIEIRIPDSWRVQLQGSAVFGAYEDKTIPPRPETGVEPPALVIRGGTAFGSVQIRN
jgi:predicted membrane protein